MVPDFLEYLLKDEKIFIELEKDINNVTLDINSKRKKLAELLI